MFRVELGKALRRCRTWALAALAAALPVLIVIGLVLGGAPGPGEGPPFLGQILRSGFFTPLASLAILQPFFSRSRRACCRGMPSPVRPPPGPCGTCSPVPSVGFGWSRRSTPSLWRFWERE